MFTVYFITRETMIVSAVSDNEPPKFAVGLQINVVLQTPPKSSSS